MDVQDFEEIYERVWAEAPMPPGVNPTSGRAHILAHRAALTAVADAVWAEAVTSTCSDLRHEIGALAGPVV